jgi:hypothetical protein
VHPANGFVMDPDNAAVVRFIQDQPIVYWAPNGGFVDGDFITFAQKAGRFLRDVGKLTDRQMAAVEDEMRAAGWVEPERWQAWLDPALAPLPVVFACPGAVPAKDWLAEAVATVQRLKIDWRTTIGPLIEFTHDLNDPRLEPLSADRRRGMRAVYETPCRRLIRMAREHHATASAAA